VRLRFEQRPIRLPTREATQPIDLVYLKVGAVAKNIGQPFVSIHEYNRKLDSRRKAIK
jgi:hypothetical protein